MSTRWRVLLAMAGGMLMCLSCAAVVYAVWPLDSIREQVVIWSNYFRMP